MEKISVSWARLERLVSFQSDVWCYATNGSLNSQLGHWRIQLPLTVSLVDTLGNVDFV